jgi:hypothetical protein
MLTLALPENMLLSVSVEHNHNLNNKEDNQQDATITVY